MKKPILYIDMDNVLVDFPSGIRQLSPEQLSQFEGRYDEVEGIFSLMRPLKGAIGAIITLSQTFDIYILSTAPWRNPSAWQDKLLWIQKHFGEDENSLLYKRLILSHHKNLLQGDYLIDDRTANGAREFKGELIQFGSEQFPDWESVVYYLAQKR